MACVSISETATNQSDLTSGSSSEIVDSETADSPLSGTIPTSPITETEEHSPPPPPPAPSTPPLSTKAILFNRAAACLNYFHYLKMYHERRLNPPPPTVGRAKWLPKLHKWLGMKALEDDARLKYFRALKVAQEYREEPSRVRVVRVVRRKGGEKVQRLKYERKFRALKNRRSYLREFVSVGGEKEVGVVDTLGE